MAVAAAREREMGIGKKDQCIREEEIGQN